MLQCINLGATAIGTTVTAAPGYPALATKHLSDITGIKFALAEDLIEATSDTGDYVLLSGVIKHTAAKLTKICNDLRMLASGPRCGLNEINLPQMQPGSSIMPGKVNPVIPEVVNQTSFLVIGLDVTVTLAASAGQHGPIPSGDRLSGPAGTCHSNSSPTRCPSMAVPIGTTTEILPCSMSA